MSLRIKIEGDVICDSCGMRIIIERHKAGTTQADIAGFAEALHRDAIRLHQAVYVDGGRSGNRHHCKSCVEKRMEILE